MLPESRNLEGGWHSNEAHNRNVETTDLRGEYSYDPIHQAGLR